MKASSMAAKPAHLKSDDIAAERSGAPAAQWPAKGLIVVVLAGALVAVRRAESPYPDSDVLWAARAGRDFLDSGRLPHSDTYSWTAHGQSWIPNSWGWNVFVGVAQRLGGYTGIALLSIAMTMVIALLVAVTAQRINARPAWTGLILQIVGGLFALFLFARAQVVDYVAVLLLPLLLSRALEGRRFWQFAAAATGAQILWMNLHSAALLGPVLVLAAGIGHVASDGEQRASTARKVAALTALMALACLATPYGTAAITHVDDVRRASAGLITEWEPIGYASIEQILAIVAVALAVTAGVFAWRARRLDTVMLLLLVGIATVTAVRFAPLAVLVAVPELAAAASRLSVRPFLVDRACALALVILTVVSAVNFSHFGEPGVRNVSDRLVKALPTGCRLLNDYRVGGDVILHRPDVPVSIDSRNDVYGRDREIAAIKQLAYPSVGLAYVDSEHITCVLAPTITPLVQALRDQPSWQVAGADDYRTLLVRQPG
jgi:hypothetical protein